MGFWSVYEHHYKRLLIIPLIILLFFISVIARTKLVTGDYFLKDISLKGGTTITYYSGQRINGVNEWVINNLGRDSELVIISDPLGGFKGYEFRVGKQLSVSEARELLRTLNPDVSDSDFSVGFQGAGVAESFFKDSLLIISVSFLLMGGVIFYYFRSIIPAISITLSTIADVIVVIGVLDLLGLQLSIAGIGALLMLIGYSTDSDVLLANNIIKQESKGLMRRLKRSLKTELTMSLAAIITSAIMYSLTSIDLIKSIALILMIGSVSDVINTWILSAGLQRWYKEWSDSR